MKLNKVLAVLSLPLLFFASCNNGGSDVTLPTFTEITLSPEQAVYHVGDSVTATITMLTAGSETLKQSTYWFATSWWRGKTQVDFQTPQEVEGKQVFTSHKIGIDEAGEQRISFWGRLEYPNWDFQPVTVEKTIHCEE